MYSSLTKVISNRRKVEPAMKVLIVKTSSLGDLIHTLPALTDAKQSLPNISFDWVAEESFAEIPGWHLAVDRVIPIALRRWRKSLISSVCRGEIFSFLKKLRHQQYDLIIDVQGLIKSAVVARMARGVSCGYSKESSREPWAASFYHNKYRVPKAMHAITRNRTLFAAVLNYELPTTTPDYGINKEIFPRASAQTRYLVFCHGTSSEKKCWVLEKWLELAGLAVAKGFIIYLPWGNELELERAKRIASLQPTAIRVLPKLDLTAIAALINEACGVVALDTGFAHMAVAFDRPTVLLYGPTDPKLCGAWGGERRQLNLINFNTLTASAVWQQLAQLMNN